MHIFLTLAFLIKVLFYYYFYQSFSNLQFLQIYSYLNVTETIGPL